MPKVEAACWNDDRHSAAAPADLTKRAESSA